MPLCRCARFAFIEFSSETEAAAAIQKANGYKLDKAHTFVVNSFEDHAKYMAVPDEEKEFEPPPYVPKESLLQWMEDENARDQYVVRYNDETEIWWNDPTKPNPEPAYARHNWSDSYVSWCAAHISPPPPPPPTHAHAKPSPDARRAPPSQVAARHVPRHLPPAGHHAVGWA